jgi:crossover junction endodeoxyribonuclease RusA
MLKFTFPIKAVPKERPRFSKFGGTYTPCRTRKFERFIHDYARAQMGGKKPLESNVECLMTFQFKAAKSTKLVYPHQDLDNLIKAVGDALNGIAYKDDKQLILISAGKYFGPEDLITVQLTEL